MFSRKVSCGGFSDGAPVAKSEPPKVYVTSLKNVGSITRARLSPKPSKDPNGLRRSLQKIADKLIPSLSPSWDDDNDGNDDDVLISDSVSGSKRFQRSIISLDEKDEKETVYCQRKEAAIVVERLKSRAQRIIDQGEGRRTEALQLLNKALTIQQKLYGKNHLDVADTLNSIGCLLSIMGDEYTYMAMDTLEGVMLIRQSLEGEGSEGTALAVDNLWRLFHNRNDSLTGRSTNKSPLRSSLRSEADLIVMG